MNEGQAVVQDTRGDSHDAVLRTFLIADVRGYTKFTNEQGVPAGARLAERFASLCKEVVPQHEGEVLELRGDEALCVFTSPRQALLGAVELQGRFQEEMRQDPTLPLRVGMGIDMGEVVPVHGGYRGKALNLSARLCSLAGPGEVFATEDVVAEADRLEGLAYVERGRVQLKGFEDPIRVIHVLPQHDLPENFPPLVSLVAKPSNLPLQATAFIGRERDIEEIAGLLRQDHVRLLTLTGPGGTGKTRLALQVGALVLDDFERGVFFVNLAPVNDPSLVPTTIAATLKVKEVPGQEILDTLVDHLRDRQMLLVLDNFEHLLEARDVVGRLILECPRLTVLITSREMLHLSGEHEYTVRPLDVPDPRHLPALDELSRYDSVALFVARAQAAKPSFTVTDENAEAIAEICQRLDGLPLAIELAAARIKLFSPEALLQRLDSRLALLTGGAKDKPTRQQTLRGAIDWSYSLLSEEEQELFAGVSVFAGGCTFEAAEAVCNPEGDLDLLEGLASLVDKSLLRQEEDEEPRFTMLETIREYAQEKLQERGEKELRGSLFAQYFVDFAQEAESTITGPDQVELFHQIDADLDNIRAAVAELRERSETESLLEMVASLLMYWVGHGSPTEVRGWLEAALEHADEVGNHAKGRAFLTLGTTATYQQDHEMALYSLRTALGLFEQDGDVMEQGRTLNMMGNAAMYRGDEARHRKWIEAALSCFREAGDERGVAVALNNLGWADIFQEEYEAGLAHAEEALSLFRKLGDLRGISQAAYTTGTALANSDRFAEGVALFREGFDLAANLGDRLTMLQLSTNLGAASLDIGDYDEAREHLRTALALFRQVGHKSVGVLTLLNMAEMAEAENNLERAAVLLSAHAALREALRLHPLKKHAQQEVRETTKRVRQALTDDQWQRAQVKGGAMTLEEAVAYALDEF